MAEKQTSDAGQKEVQKAFDEAHEKGYIGESADPIDDDRYSLKTGPESPTVAEQRGAIAKEQS
jgi:hypothetical protein